MGRPAIQITDELCEKAEKLAAQGLTLKQIANVLGIGERTIYEKMAKFPQFSHDIKRGQDRGVADVTNALYESAIGLKISEDRIVKVPGGGEEVVRIERNLPPNVVAGIFFLKNRGGWKDKKDVEHSGNVSHKHEGISRSVEILREFRGIRPAQLIEGPVQN